MRKFKPGDRVMYAGNIWTPGLTGTVRESRGDDAWHVHLDRRYLGFTHLTMLERNMVLFKEAPVPEVTVRARVLDEAKRITATDRNSAYGEPEDNFQRIADYWDIWLKDRLKEGESITAEDVPALMIFVKMAREMNAPKEDNKTDGAGYFACWAEIAANKKG